MFMIDKVDKAREQKLKQEAAVIAELRRRCEC